MIAKQSNGAKSSPISSVKRPECTSGKPLWDLYRDGITQGLLGKFTTCPEKLRLSMIEGLAPLRTGSALAFGSLVHEALDSMYKGYMATREKFKGKPEMSPGTEVVRKALGVVLKRLEAEDRKRIATEPQKNADLAGGLEEMYGMADVLLESYFKQWATDYSHYDWVSLEQTFNVPMVSQHSGKTIPIRGKFDGVFRVGGKLWLFETKTKSRVEEDAITDRMHYDLQVMTYLWAMKHVFGETPCGVLYNIIRKPALKQTMKESLKQFHDRVRADVESRPEWYFIRYEAAILPDEMKKFEGELHQMVAMVERWNEGLFHWRDSNACQTRYGNCEFLPVCGRNDFSYIRRRDLIYPELSMKGEE